RWHVVAPKPTILRVCASDRVVPLVANRTKAHVTVVHMHRHAARANLDLDIRFLLRPAIAPGYPLYIAFVFRTALLWQGKKPVDRKALRVELKKLLEGPRKLRVVSWRSPVPSSQRRMDAFTSS